VQVNVRKRILRAFVARGHIEACDAKDMAAYAHGGGFSVDAGVRIEAVDRAGLDRLLRYCARPPFAIDRLKQRGAEIWSTAAAKGTQSPCSPTSTAVNWCSPTGADQPHRPTGAATAHPPASLLRCAGTQLTLAGGGDGHGAGRAGDGAYRAQFRG